MEYGIDFSVNIMRTSRLPLPGFVPIKAHNGYVCKLTWRRIGLDVNVFQVESLANNLFRLLGGFNLHKVFSWLQLLNYNYGSNAKILFYAGSNVGQWHAGQRPENDRPRFADSP